jgi:hypothetical protein
MKQKKPKYEVGDNVFWIGEQLSEEVILHKGIIVGLFYDPQRPTPLYKLKCKNIDKYDTEIINRIGISEEFIKLTPLGVLKKAKGRKHERSI